MPRIADAVQLSGPPVAANAQDRWVVPVAQGMIVITDDGRVFGHRLADGAVKEALQLPAPRTAANPQDRWIARHRNFLAVITSDGRFFAHRLHVPDSSVFTDVFPDRVEDAQEAEGPKVAANPQDKWVLVYGGRIFVITDSGDVFVHPLHFTNRSVPDRVEGAHQLPGPKVAANPQDKWVLASNSRIFVITEDGGVFMHSLFNDRVGDAIRLEGPPVAAQSVDKWVYATEGPDPLRIVVVTADGRVFAHAVTPTPGEQPR